jgi:hypothetical protein
MLKFEYRYIVNHIAGLKLMMRNIGIFLYIS